ncbi:MAG: hypothetical protein LIO99_10180 [Clostridiales bacterium]|nr:hypothetical protein [Clostridiales bacterium]
MKKYIKSAEKFISVLAVPMVLFLIFHLLAPDNITLTNIPSLLKQAIAPAILGWGVLLNMRVGNWDFSVGSSVLLSAIIGGNLAKMLNAGLFGLVICCCAVGLLCGAVVGLLYYILKIPTIIVSIGMLLIYESLGSIVFDGGGVMIPSEWIVFGRFPCNFILLLVVGCFAYHLINNTKIGYNIRAVGNNATVAQANGIDAYRVKTSALILVGLFAGIYALTNLGMNGVQRTVSSMGTMSTCFDAMMCVFVGMALSYGVNVVIAIYIGSFFMQIIKLGFMVFGLPTEFNSVIIAIIVLLFIALNNNADLFEKLRHKTGRKEHYEG